MSAGPWFQPILESQAEKDKFDDGVRKWKLARTPDASQYIPLYRGPDGDLYDWGHLRKLYDRQQQDRVSGAELSSAAVPTPSSSRFQHYILRMFNQTDVAPDFVSLPRRKQRLTEYMADIATRPKDGCAQGWGAATLLPHQAVVLAMARLRAADRIRTAGLLAMHSTGAGKTLEGLCAFLAFWNKRTGDGRPYALLSVSTKGNQESNRIRKLARDALHFFGDVFESDVEGLPRRPFKSPTSLDEAEAVIKKRIEVGLKTIAASPQAFDRLKKAGRADLYTYTKLAHDCDNGLFKRGDALIHHALIVVDEIQFLLSPPPDELKFAPEYRSLLRTLSGLRSLSTTWVLGMTATPGSTAAEVRQVLNVIKGLPRHFTASTDLSTAARGLVSYAQVQGDLHHFPRLEVRAQCVFVGRGSRYLHEYLRLVSEFDHLRDSVREFDEELVLDKDERAERSEALYLSRVDKYKTKMAAYRKSLRTEDPLEEPKEPHRKEKLDPRRDPAWTFDPAKKSKFYKRLREASDFMFLRGDKDELVEAETDLRKEGLWCSHVRDKTCTKPPGYFLVVAGPKLSRLVANIGKHAGKHYVYTSNAFSVMLIAAMLEEGLGMRQLKQECRGRTCKSQEFREGQTYFVMLDNVSSARTLGEGRQATSMNKWAYLNKIATRIEAAKEAVDDPVNLTGDKVKVVLATKENYKGVDLKALRYIHLLEPMADFGDFVQLVGRGPRFCSHAGLKPVRSQWRVGLFPYWLCIRGVEDERLQPDAYVYNLSVRRHGQEWGTDTDVSLQRASVDYLVFKDNIHLNYGKQRQELLSISCGQKGQAARRRDDPSKKGGSPAKLTREQKESFRLRSRRQKARVAAARAAQHVPALVELHRSTPVRVSAAAAGAASVKHRHDPSKKGGYPAKLTPEQKESFRMRSRRQKARVAAARSGQQAPALVELHHSSHHASAPRVSVVVAGAAPVKRRHDPSKKGGYPAKLTRERKESFRMRSRRQKARVAARSRPAGQ